MRTAVFFSCAVAFPLLVLACGGSDDEGAAGSGGSGGSGAGTTGTGATSGLPCDVDAILAQNCRQCHAAPPVYGAPMPLVTLDDLRAPANSDPSRKVYELVGERIHDDAKPMPQPPNPRLSEDDLAVVDAFVAAGAPAAEGSCGGGGAGGGGGGVLLSCTPDVTLQPATPWTMPKDTQDEYVCYGVDVNIGAKRHMIGLAPFIDNSTIVHHILLYQSDSAYDPTPKPCGGGAKGRLVGVWAPGGQALELPPEAGFPLEGTAHFVLQIHYSNLTALDGEQDRSGYQLCTTTDLRPNDADIAAFGTVQIDVPAHGSQDVTCQYTIPAGAPELHVMAGMPHMHKIGRLIATQVTPSGGSAPVNLGKADPWDFNNQVWTTLDVGLAGGDVVRTRCAWDNPGSSDVHFGEQTLDEMCFSFVMYYPRIETPGWNWILPSVLSNCSPTP